MSNVSQLVDRIPHTLISFAWILTWIKQFHYMVNGNETLHNYHQFLIHADSSEPIGKDILQSVYDFYDYFYLKKNMFCFDSSTSFLEIYGSSEHTFPFSTLYSLLSDKEKNMFRSLTFDVFLTIVNPSIIEELNIKWNQSEYDEFINSLLHIKK